MATGGREMVHVTRVSACLQLGLVLGSDPHCMRWCVGSSYRNSYLRLQNSTLCCLVHLVHTQLQSHLSHG